MEHANSLSAEMAIFAVQLSVILIAARVSGNITGVEEAFLRITSSIRGLDDYIRAADETYNLEVSVDFFEDEDAE